MEDKDVYEQLYDAFTNPSVAPARRLFGTVEYCFVPVPVIEGILADQIYGDEDVPDEAEETPDQPVWDESPIDPPVTEDETGEDPLSTEVNDGEGDPDDIGEGDEEE